MYICTKKLFFFFKEYYIKGTLMLDGFIEREAKWSLAAEGKERKGKIVSSSSSNHKLVGSCSSSSARRRRRKQHCK